MGESSLTFTVEFKIKNVFKVDHQIWMEFPYWNQRSTSPQHMIRSTTPNCYGLITLVPTLTCEYDILNRFLKIKNAVYSE